MMTSAVPKEKKTEFCMIRDKFTSMLGGLERELCHHAAFS